MAIDYGIILWILWNNIGTWKSRWYLAIAYGILLWKLLNDIGTWKSRWYLAIAYGIIVWILWDNIGTSKLHWYFEFERVCYWNSRLAARFLLEFMFGYGYYGII